MAVTKVYIDDSAEALRRLDEGCMLIDCQGNSYWKPKDQNAGFIKETEEGIQYLITQIEFERDVYFVYKEIF